MTMEKAIKEVIVAHIFNDEMKAKLIKSVNDSVDVPLLSEKTEERVFSALWDCVEDTLKEAILKG